jgi:hypothetical protein
MVRGTREGTFEASPPIPGVREDAYGRGFALDGAPRSRPPMSAHVAMMPGRDAPRTFDHGSKSPQRKKINKAAPKTQ